MLSSPAECFTGHKDRAFSACLDFTATERRLVHSDESSGIHLPTRLRSTPITALHHYYAGSDSSQLLVTPRGIPASRKLTSEHSIANHYVQYCRGFSWSLSSTRHLIMVHAALCQGIVPHEYGLHLALAGSPLTHNRIAFVSYGLLFPLLLLPTPPRDDAVTVEYKSERLI